MSGAPMAPKRRDWWWFPHALIGSMLAVLVVNGVMVYDALSTFPGEAGQDGFDLSNAYDRVLELSAQQQALGWRVGVDADAERHPVLRATDRAGLPLRNATIEARAERPLGPKQATPLVLHGTEAGRYVAEQTLLRGNWVVFLTVVQDGRTRTSTERLAVP